MSTVFFDHSDDKGVTDAQIFAAWMRVNHSTTFYSSTWTSTANMLANQHYDLYIVWRAQRLILEGVK